MDQINVRVVLCLSTDNFLLSLLPVVGREGFVNFFFILLLNKNVNMCSLLLAVLPAAPQPSLVAQKQHNPPPSSLMHATLCFWQTGHFLSHCPQDEGNPSGAVQS